MTSAQTLTLWSIRIAGALYAAALAAWMAGRWQEGRIAWTLGCASYLVHVAAAFAAYHGWSHHLAYLDTARQTAEKFGWDWGGGLYFNYLFTIVWGADVLWIWKDAGGYRRRSAWIAGSIHLFMAFMFLNGAIVFASGWTRWVSAGVAMTLFALWLRRRQSVNLYR